MGKTIIKNAKIFDGEKIIDAMNIYISESKIQKLIEGRLDIQPVDVEVIDAENKFVTPGFIDIHMHGAGGYDVMDGTEESIEQISLLAAKHGTTSYLPSTVTMSEKAIYKSIKTIEVCMKNGKGLNILGVHLEGPFINKVKKGAQNEKYIQTPSVEAYNRMVGNHPKIIKRVTLAPEIDQAMVLIQFLKEKGVCVSAGHTCATLEEFYLSVDSGVSLCTHLFNGMKPLHHRNPGVVGGALIHEDVFVELIPDLFHLHQDIIRLIVNAKGEDRCILITDALSAACLKEGIYTLGDQKVFVNENGARLKNGSLAGSAIMMDEAVKNMVHKVGIDVKKVLKMATVNPAKVLRIDNDLGRIKEGYDADINILDKNLNIEKTILKGNVVV